MCPACQRMPADAHRCPGPVGHGVAFPAQKTSLIAYLIGDPSGVNPLFQTPWALISCAGKLHGVRRARKSKPGEG